jgi:hypothetical protein
VTLNIAGEDSPRQPPTATYGLMSCSNVESHELRDLRPGTGGYSRNIGRGAELRELVQASEAIFVDLEGPANSDRAAGEGCAGELRVSLL